MDIFEILGYKDRVKPYDKRVPKTNLFVAGELTKAERDLLTDRVEEVRLAYVLNKYTLTMNEVVSSEEHYDSILWVLVSLRSEVSISKLSRIIQETLPSPTLIIFELDGKYLFSSALKRLSKSEKGKAVVEEYHHSHWIDVESNGGFISSISLNATPTIDYKQAYEYIHRRIYEEKHSDIVAEIVADNFNDLKTKTEIELVRQREIERLTKLINQKSLPLREKMELAKKIKELK